MRNLSPNGDVPIGQRNRTFYLCKIDTQESCVTQEVTVTRASLLPIILHSVQRLHCLQCLHVRKWISAAATRLINNFIAHFPYCLLQLEQIGQLRLHLRLRLSNVISLFIFIFAFFTPVLIF